MFVLLAQMNIRYITSRQPRKLLFHLNPDSNKLEEEEEREKFELGLIEVKPRN